MNNLKNSKIIDLETKICSSTVTKSTKKTQKPFFEISENPKFQQNGNFAISTKLVEKFQQIKEKQIEEKQQQYQKMQSFRNAMNQQSSKKIVLFGKNGNTIIMNQNDGSMVGYSL